MASIKTLTKYSISNFKRLVKFHSYNVDAILSPPKAEYEKGIPIVYVKYFNDNIYHKMPLNKLDFNKQYLEIIRKKSKNNYEIDYSLFNYTDYLKSIDDVLNNTINGYKTSLNYKELKK